MIPSSVKRLLRKAAPGLADTYVRLRSHLDHARFYGRNISEVFSDIHSSNHWRSKASLSGTGSTLDQTSIVRDRLPKLLGELGVTKLLDVPCGDFHWMQEVSLGSVEYTGGDIVQRIVDENQKLFPAPNRTFVTLDLTSSELPPADLILCRDCLVHLSYADIRRALSNVRRSKAKYLLTTSFPSRKNHDIVTGNWRALNLQAAPFNFPEPLLVIDEMCTEGEGRYADKSLMLWKTDSLPRLD